MPASAPQVRARRIRVRADRIDCELEVPLACLRVDERAARRVLGLLPNLERHVCVNGRGETFGEELVGTELAHLVEHVALELQGRAQTRPHAEAHAADGGASHMPAPAGLLRGHTSWAAELAQTRPLGYALMRVTLGFENDLVALQALKDACEIAGWAAGGPGAPPDVPGMVADLRRLARQ